MVCLKNKQTYQLSETGDEESIFDLLHFGTRSIFCSYALIAACRQDKNYITGKYKGDLKKV